MNHSNSLAKTQVKNVKNRRRVPARAIWIAFVAAITCVAFGTVCWVLMATNATGNEGSAMSALSDVNVAEWGYYQDHHRYASLGQLRTVWHGGYPFLSSEYDYRLQIAVNPSGKSYYAVAEPKPVTIWGMRASFLRKIQPRVCYTDGRINEIIYAPLGAVVPPGGFQGHPPTGSPWTTEG